MSTPDSGLRVLHLRSSSGFFGAEAVIQSYFAALHDGPVAMELALLTANQEHPLLRRIAAPAHLLPASSGFSRAVLQQIRSMVARGGFRLVHSHDYKSDIYAVLLASRDVRIITTLHGWTKSAARVRFYEWLDRLLLPRFDHIVAVSSELHQEAVRRTGEPSRCHLLTNAIDTSRFSGPRKPASADRLDLVSVGRLSPEKGLHHLIAAMPGLPATVHLTLIGDGPLRETLQSQCRALGVSDRIHFLGLREEIPGLLRSMDIFVMPSLREGMPMALLEAMAAGCTPVASAVGAIPEVLDHGRAGLLVLPGQPGQLLDALATLAGDPGRRVLLGRAAQERVRRLYDLAGLRERLLSLYRDAAGREVPS